MADDLAFALKLFSRGIHNRTNDHAVLQGERRLERKGKARGWFCEGSVESRIAAATETPNL